MSAEPVPTSELAPLLAAWLPQQRWFGGGDEVEVTALHRAGRLTSEPYVSEVVLVETPTATYNVPLVYRPERDDILEHVHVGAVTTAAGAAETEDGGDGDGGELHVYDALHDKAVTAAWLSKIIASTEDEGLKFVVGAEVENLPVGEPSLVMSAEQSNTSLVFGDAILKVFRRVEEGRNPDIEVHAALAERGGRHVARLLGHVQASWTDAAGNDVTADLAMLQQFLRSATDGWNLAQISVRDLIAEGDLHADEVGGDFAGEAMRLGVATAETHADLAQALPTDTYGPAELAELAQAMRRRLDEAAAEVPAVAPHVDGLAAVLDRVAGLTRPVAVQRIHGDLHLGQVLRTSQRWVVLDFEGEPLKPIAERVALDSPMRDVAGMLRSFDYAGRHSLVDHPNDPQIAYRADEWSKRNRDFFLDGYARGAGTDLRDDAELRTLLAAYEADKAVYEVVYEARLRPAWIPIPLAAIARLAAG